MNRLWPLSLTGLLLAAPVAAHPTPAPKARTEAEAARASAMASAAGAFLGTLSEPQRQAATRPFDDAVARESWHFLPLPSAPRQGIEVATLDAAQRIALHRFLSTALSSQGYLKASQIMWLDDVLHDLETAALQTAPPGPNTDARRQILPARRSDAYVLLFRGEPTAARWGFILSGHHLALNINIIDGRIAFAPGFLGASPQRVPTGRYAGWQMLQHEIDRGGALIASLDATQRAKAMQAATVPQTLLYARTPPPAGQAPLGISAAALTDPQRSLLAALIREYVGNSADEAAARQLAMIEADGPSNLHFAWWGPTDDTSQRFMYRVQGPSVLIEFVREPTPDGGPNNHVHSILRDPRNDNGADWLGQHYRERHKP